MSGQSKEYREYMKSDSWERKKRERLKIDGINAQPADILQNLMY